MGRAYVRACRCGYLEEAGLTLFSLRTTVVIVAALDVIFAQIVAHPGFNDHQRLGATVGDAVPLANLDDDLRAAIESNRFGAVAAKDDLALTLDDEPMLFAAGVALKAGALTRRDSQTLGAPPCAFAQDFEVAPRAMFGGARHGFHDGVG